MERTVVSFAGGGARRTRVIDINNWQTPRSLSDRVALHDGNTMPCLGLGTFMRFRKWEPGTNIMMTKTALEAGYKQIDTAAMYGTEEEIGVGLKEFFESKENDLTRKDIFITTKLWPNEMAEGKIEDGCRSSLKRLQLDYVDLYHIHWPVPLEFVNAQTRVPKDENGNVQYLDRNITDVYLEMQKLVDLGLTKSLGVCNMTLSELKDIIEKAKYKPVTLQVEAHPYFIQQDLKDFCAQHDIVITSYCPLANLDPTNDELLCPLKDEYIKGLAVKYNKSVAQVILRWHTQHGFIPIPKSTHAERIKENGDIFDFHLTSEEVSKITALDKDHRTTNPPVFAKNGKPLWPRP